MTPPASTHNADTLQIRMMAVQAAKEAISEYRLDHPETKKMNLPAPVLWAGGIIAAIMTGLSLWAMQWGFSTLNSLQLSVTRMETKMQSPDPELALLRQRIDRLEKYHEDGAR